MFSGKSFLRLLPALGLAALLLPATSRASDHGDTAENYNKLGADMTDVFIFPSTSVASNVVVVMNVHGLIPAGQSSTFDPTVLYQMKFDVDGNYVEDLVVQFRFVGTGADQQVVVVGPAKPLMTGTTTAFGRPYATRGMINQTFSPTPGMTVFAGVRADPFFFDLNQFYQILPDRMTPLQGKQVNFASIMAANTPQKSGFSQPGTNFLANLNVLSIVVEMPRAKLTAAGKAPGVVSLWETTSIFDTTTGSTFKQQDRLARPAINEALATVTNNRHEINNKVNPTDDVNTIKTDILGFMNFPAGRSAATANTLAAVLVPDVLVADLSQSGIASYLGYETGGFTGGKFGGRALADDVVDLDLGAVFGNTLAALGLVPDDGKELDGRNGTPVFTTDYTAASNVYQNVFPYLGNPH